ncbi:hypothetical protein B566_EDAN015912, partial [Ephemera danica]
MFCASIHAELITPTVSDDNECIYDHVEAWTTGRSNYRPGIFRWCNGGLGENLTLNEAMWKDGEPDAENFNQFCVQLQKGKKDDTLYLTDENCESLVSALCKLPPKPTEDCLPACELKKRDALSHCKSLGMELASFETKEEVYCMSQIQFKDSATSAKLWTSGIQGNCHSNFRWCAGEQWPISSNLLEDGDGACVAVVVELESN